MMLIQGLMALSILLCIQMPTQTKTDFDLESYQWKNRVLITFAPSAEHPSYMLQKQQFKKQEANLTERDLVIINVFGQPQSEVNGKLLDAQVATALRQKFSVAVNEFAVVLIGKDGGEKKRSREPISFDQLFSVIDAMPMRRDEIRRGRPPE